MQRVTTSTNINADITESKGIDWTMSTGSEKASSSLLIGVLALQGAFEEHEQCLHKIGCRTRQIRTVQDLLLTGTSNNNTNENDDLLEEIDGIILPGGESTAMGLIGSCSTYHSDNQNMWQCLQQFTKPIWGTCAGMILLAEQCIGTSAVIEDGQALIGGMNICVVRNYFGAQISSFELPVPGPPTVVVPIQSIPNNNDHAKDNTNDHDTTNTSTPSKDYPGIFIRAPAILSVGPDVTILGTVLATPCRQAAITLHELDRKIANGENVIKVGVVDVFERTNQDPNEPPPQLHTTTTTITKDSSNSTTGTSTTGGLRYKSTAKPSETNTIDSSKDNNTATSNSIHTVVLPGAADGTNAREVICAAQKGNLLCTAFHPELTTDYRWHEYFVQMVRKSKIKSEGNVST
jgi:pyridoxal 5'-phosphate synthase pdxT subunit